jgi:hypothetical protein
MGDMRDACKILIENSKGRRTYRRTRLCGREDNIRMDLREIRGEDVDCIYLAQDSDQWRVLSNTVMKFRVP